MDQLASHRIEKALGYKQGCDVVQLYAQDLRALLDRIEELEGIEAEFDEALSREINDYKARYA